MKKLFIRINDCSIDDIMHQINLKTETVENPDGSVTTTTTVSESGLGVDTAKINGVKEKRNPESMLQEKR